jgi:hypothetical protein
MPQSALASPSRVLATFLAAGCMAASALAQTPQASPTPPALSGSSPASASKDSDAANSAFLASAGKIYYSAEKTGLTAFDCAVHPDWRTMFLSAKPGSVTADDDPRILALKTTKITLHGRLAGGSTLDWNLPADPAKPIDQDTTGQIDEIHKASERTLLGFMQFWSPFLDGSVIPSTIDGLQITKTEKGHTIHADQGGTQMTEVLDNQMVMQHFNVAVGGAKIDFSPRYKPTDQGLLVNGFLAKIQAPGAPADQAEEMHVEIDYQTVTGFPLPTTINIEVVGEGKFNFALDGCVANPK